MSNQIDTMRSKNISQKSHLDFSPEVTFLKWKKCWLLFEKDQALEAIKKCQSYLREVQHISLNFPQSPNLNLTAAEFIFTAFSALWASRIFRWDEMGVETNIGELLMTDAETILPKLDSFTENDHILHVKLVHIYCQIRLLNLNLIRENVDKIEELFQYAEIYRKSCGSSLHCVVFAGLLDEIWLNVCWRVKRIDDSEILAQKMWDYITIFEKGWLIVKKMLTILYSKRLS